MYSTHAKISPAYTLERREESAVLYKKISELIQNAGSKKTGIEESFIFPRKLRFLNSHFCDCLQFRKKQQFFVYTDIIVNIFSTMFQVSLEYDNTIRRRISE